MRNEDENEMDHGTEQCQSYRQRRWFSLNKYQNIQHTLLIAQQQQKMQRNESIEMN